jgi:hypothetical protein
MIEDLLKTKKALDLFGVNRRLRDIEGKQIWTLKAVRSVNGIGPDDLGNVNVTGSGGISDHALLTHLDYASAGHTGFQPTLVSGTSIKTINGTTLLGSGDLTIGGSPAGLDTYVQFNDGGAFGGVAGFIFDKTQNLLQMRSSWNGITEIYLRNDLVDAGSGVQFHLRNDGGCESILTLLSANTASSYFGTSMKNTLMLRNGQTLILGSSGSYPVVLGTNDTARITIAGTGGTTFAAGNDLTITDRLRFGLTPTVGTHSEGKIYWDATWKTLSLNLEDNVNLQLGQETQAYVYNGTGSAIDDGKVVYITGATAGGVPTIALAKADSEATSFVLGVVTSSPNIGDGEYGYVTIRGHVNDLDTSAFSVGDSLYLSETTAGELTNVAPSAGNYDVRVGRVMIDDASTGRIYVNVRPMSKLTDLGDVTIATPLTDQILKYNGTEWVNGAEATSSAGKGVEFFYDGTEILATGANNDNHVETLSKTPWASAEEVETTVVNNNTVLADAYLYNTALNRTSVPAGTWNFISYCAVSSGLAVTQILHNVMRVRVGAGTVTITGSGTSRTATSSTGTPFATTEIDTGGTIDSDSYIQTPLGLFRITARTSDTVVTVTTPTTYTNESTVAYTVQKRLFQTTTGEINNTATAPLYAGIQAYTIPSVQVAYTVVASDKLAVYRFGKTTRTADTSIFFAYGGTTRYSRIETPFTTLHGDLAGLQGGTGAVPSEEYYHLTSAQHTLTTGATATPTASKIPVADAGGKLDGWITGFPTGAIVGTTDTQTLTNKRINPRIYTTSSIAGTPGVLTPEIDTYDNFEITAQAAALNIANHSTSTPVQGNKIIIAITSDATPRALTYGTNYVAKGGVALPSTTVASKTTTLGFMWNAGLGKWNLLAVGQEA